MRCLAEQGAERQRKAKEQADHLAPPLGCLALPSPAPVWACSELLSEPEEDAGNAAADGKVVRQPPIAAVVLVHDGVQLPHLQQACKLKGEKVLPAQSSSRPQSALPRSAAPATGQRAPRELALAPSPNLSRYLNLRGR